MLWLWWQSYYKRKAYQINTLEDFHGGTVHPFTDARDMGSIPDPGRFHMLRLTKARVSQLLSLCSTTREATTMRRPGTTTRESPHSSEDPVKPKGKKILNVLYTSNLLIQCYMSSIKINQ